MATSKLVYAVGFTSLAAYALYRYISYARVEAAAAARRKPKLSRDALLQVLEYTEAEVNALVHTHTHTLTSIKPTPELVAAASELLRIDLAKLEARIAAEASSRLGAPFTSQELRACMDAYSHAPTDGASEALTDPEIMAIAARIRKTLAPHLLSKARAREGFAHVMSAQVAATPDIVRAGVDTCSGNIRSPMFQMFIRENLNAVARVAASEATGFSSVEELQTAIAGRFADDRDFGLEMSAMMKEGVDAINGAVNRTIMQMSATGEIG